MPVVPPAPSDLKAPVAWLTLPVGIVVFWAFYGLVFTLQQVLLSSTLPLDDALAAETIQRHFAAAYQIRNPPLYDWLLWLFGLGFGPGELSHRVLRYLLVGLLGGLVYAALVQARVDRRIAAAMSLGLILFHWFGWGFHYRITHTLPMLVVALAAWMAAVALRRQPSWRKALAFGLLLGLGTIAKWSFPMFAAALVGAFLLDRDGHRALLHPRGLVVLAAALVVVLPVAWGVSHLDGSLIGMAAGNLVESGSYVERVVTGLVKLPLNSFLFLLPWSVVVGLGCLRRPGAIVATPDKRALRRMALTVVGLMLVLTVLGVVLFGVSRVEERYIYPHFVLLPVAAGLWLETRDNVDYIARFFIVAGVAVAVVCLVLRVIQFTAASPLSGGNSLRPYDELAATLTGQGLGNARFVTLEARDAGNLLAMMPDARAAGILTARRLPPPGGADGPCVLLWYVDRVSPDRPDETPPAPPDSFVGIDPAVATAAVRLVRAPWPKLAFAAPTVARWAIAAGNAAEPVCREVYRDVAPAN